MIESPVRAAPQVRRDLDEVAHIVEDSSRRERFRRVGKIAPLLNRLTDAIHKGWLFLPEDIKSHLLEVGRDLDDFLDEGREKKVHRSVFQRLWLALSNDERDDAFEFGLAVSRFRVELERALAAEQAVKFCSEESIASDPLALAELNKGYDEDAAGLGTVYTVEELRSRLSTH
jgi:hypothetical protein